MDGVHVKYPNFRMLLAEVMVWPDRDIFIDRVATRIMVFSARELISSICCAWLVFQEDVVLFAFWQVSGDSRPDFPRLPIVSQVGVIRID